MPSSAAIDVKTQGAGTTTMHLPKDCPLAISLGEEVSKGYAFIWTPTVKPFFANANYVRVSCPKSRRYEADFVRNNVSHFSIKLDSQAKDGQPAGTRPGYRGGGSRFYPKNRGETRPILHGQKPLAHGPGD